MGESDPHHHFSHSEHTILTTITTLSASLSIFGSLFVILFNTPSLFSSSSSLSPSPSLPLPSSQSSSSISSSTSSIISSRSLFVSSSVATTKYSKPRLLITLMSIADFMIAISFLMAIFSAPEIPSLSPSTEPGTVTNNDNDNSTSSSSSSSSSSSLTDTSFDSDTDDVYATTDAACLVSASLLQFFTILSFLFSLLFSFYTYTVLILQRTSFPFFSSLLSIFIFSFLCLSINIYSHTFGRSVVWCWIRTQFPYHRFLTFYLICIGCWCGSAVLLGMITKGMKRRIEEEELREMGEVRRLAEEEQFGIGDRRGEERRSEERRMRSVEDSLNSPFGQSRSFSSSSDPPVALPLQRLPPPQLHSSLSSLPSSSSVSLNLASSSSSSSLPSSSSLLVIFRLRSYLILFLFLRIWGLLNRLEQFIYSDNPIFFLYLLHATFSPASGLGNAIIFITQNQQIKEKWKGLWKGKNVMEEQKVEEKGCMRVSNIKARWEEWRGRDDENGGDDAEGGAWCWRKTAHFSFGEGDANQLMDEADALHRQSSFEFASIRSSTSSSPSSSLPSDSSSNIYRPPMPRSLELDESLNQSENRRQSSIPEYSPNSLSPSSSILDSL